MAPITSGCFSGGKGVGVLVAEGGEAMAVVVAGVTTSSLALEVQAEKLITKQMRM